MTMAVFGIFMVAPIAILNEIFEREKDNDDFNLAMFFRGLSAFATYTGYQAMSVFSPTISVAN